MNVTEHLTRKFIGAVEDEWQLYSHHAPDYEIGLPIGFGASSIVYSAKYKPSNTEQPIPCAIKVLDLDRLPPSALRLLQNETQLMSLSKHPNVLRVRGSWVEGHKLYIAMRLMNAGSVADVMRYQWPAGLEEEVIRCILKQALQGLNYFHINGLIHRDVKAANLLVDDDGTVLLGDLGVAAFLWDSEGLNTSQTNKAQANNSVGLSHTNPPLVPKLAILGKRRSFVGTPCWMAPEVINRKQYDASADIWSFGITAIELAQGRAPRSRLDPQKVLVMTVTEIPPQLERTGQHKYSSAFGDIVALCLNKDPSKRPTASELLQMPFFRNARRPSYLCSTILRGLPPLTFRQERRKQRSILTHATLDSWDFTSSVPGTPTTSIHSYHRRPKSLLLPEDVFEMEDVDLATPGGDVDTPSNGLDGAARRSRAEAYVVQIRTRHRSSLGRGYPSHSRSSSYCSDLSQHHLSSRPQSHEDSRPMVHSIQESVATKEESENPGPDGEGTSIPNVPQGADAATLHLPVFSPLRRPSTSPTPSSRSSASVTSSGGSPWAPSIPPSLFMTSAKSQPTKLWRKLVGKPGSDAEKDKDAGRPPSGVRKKSFGSVLGRTALVGADLVRTASRTMTSSKQTR